MSWVDPSQYDPVDICPICREEYGIAQAIYKTPCNHLFHNNCLQAYCHAQGDNITCPTCRSDVGYACMDVWAFKNKALGNPNGNELFHGNQHILQIYHAQPGHAPPQHAQPNGPQPNVYGGRSRRNDRTRRRAYRARGRKVKSRRTRR